MATSIPILITLWFSGFTMTIDGYGMYRIQTMKQCERHLEYIEKDMYAEKGMCSTGDIRQEIHESWENSENS